MDGFTGFKTATTEELPDAVAVMDPFNVVRLAGDALDRCRRRVLRSIQQKSTASEGRQHVLDTLAWLTPQLAGLELHVGRVAAGSCPGSRAKPCGFPRRFPRTSPRRPGRRPSSVPPYHWRSPVRWVQLRRRWITAPATTRSRDDPRRATSAMVRQQPTTVGL